MVNSIQTNAINAIDETISKTIHCIEGLSEEMIRQKPSEDEWSVMQIIAHMAEAIPFWIGEIRNIIGNQNELWGRGLTHEGRLQAVADDNVDLLSVETVLDALRSSTKQVAELLEELTDDQLLLTAPSRNPRFEGKTIEFIVNHLIVEHIEKHFGQIQRNLGR